ncbi:hypothetical protein I2503_08100 [Streptococcus mitis]|nr:hypothetical protein [Streptococcus sp. NLN64]
MNNSGNSFLEEWIQTFNQTFGGKAKESVFEVSPCAQELNLILARVSQRVVHSGHHIRYQNKYYIPIDEKGKEIFFLRGTKALVLQAFDENIYLNIAEKTYQTKELLEHELYSKTFDQPEENKKERRKYIPPQSHPWKLASFTKYLQRIGKTQEEIQELINAS